jgi:DNA-binding MarR family transcriptional regulator
MNEMEINGPFRGLDKKSGILNILVLLALFHFLMRAPVKTEPDLSSVAAQLPLSTLLSQVLIAFTIEFDNEFESLTPHRTTISTSAAGSRSGPWLVSMVMWSNFMRLVAPEGVTVGELQRLARTAKLSLAGMERWGYIVVEHGPGGSRARPTSREWVVRPTAKGRRAQEIWRPLFGVIEKRWQARFGAEEIERLRKALRALVSRIDVELPEYLPVLGYGFFAEVPQRKGRVPAVQGAGNVHDLHLVALLSKVLLAFAIHFERESDVSLAMSANVLRLLSEKGVRLRDLPRLSGVSKEAIKMSVGFLDKRRYVSVEPDPGALRTKLVRLTPKGREAQDAYRRRLGVVEEEWESRFGKENLHNLRQSLALLVGGATAQDSPLFRGLDPLPGGWRASVRKPDTLPHYPMVLHRGGFPDGS